jgi:tripartite ATP-independent transporter DctM subunit
MEILGLSPLAWGAIIFATSLLMMFTGIPIWVSLAGTGLLFIFVTNPNSALMIPHKLFESLNDFTLLTIPLFILMAEAIAQSKASESLFNAIHKWFSWMPGALGVSNLIAAGLMGMVTGSGPAGAAAIGGVGIPEMKKRGYPGPFAGALVAVGSTVVILIPPSIPMIIYGITTQTSVGRLFMAGLIPGFMLVAIQCAWVVFYYKVSIEKNIKLSPPSMSPSLGAAAMVAADPETTWRERFATLPSILPFILIAFAVLGSILLGWASPSEAAGVGAVVSLLVVILLFKGYKPQTMKKVLTLTVNESSMILLIMAAALLFGFALSDVYATQTMAEGLMGLEIGKWGIFIIINLFVLLLGIFLPPAAIILLVIPIFVPVLIELGFDLIWYCVVLVLIMQVALSMPTVGLNMLIVKRMLPENTMGQLFKAAFPFLLTILVAIIILCIWPDLALWLPNVLLD